MTGNRTPADMQILVPLHCGHAAHANRRRGGVGWHHATRERERDLNSPVKGHFDFLEKKETTKSLDHDFLFNEKCGQPP